MAGGAAARATCDKHEDARAQQLPEAEAEVSLRRFPYPYRAMLAVCSDLDETPDVDVYLEVARFLNTTQATSMGPGVGLEVGNSIYFDMPPDQFAYWNADEAGRKMVQALIRSGHIDCLHSFGDLAATRAHAARALEELSRCDCRLEVWIDHSVAPTNFGADIMRGHGDESGHEAYHADLTVAHGIRYVCRGRVTSVVGQEAPPRLGGIFTPGHPFRSGRTLAKEAAKRLLARCGRARYAIHGPNRILRPCSLRDGSAVYEFLRCNPHWGGVTSCETAKGIGQVLRQAMLDRLADREGACVLYTHLGKVGDRRVPFAPSAVAAFRRLARAGLDGRVLVTTTRRLLGYLRAVREVSFNVANDGEGLRIDVNAAGKAMSSADALPGADLAGLTFYAGDPDAARVRVDGKEMPGVLRNGPDHTGRRSLSLPWRRLEFPDI